MITFKQFKQRTLLNEGSSFGITHIEDLDIESFIRFLDKIHELRAVQKLDGANLRLGVDQKDKLYTSREQKGGKRFYKQSDFPDVSAYDGFRAAHEVIMQFKTEIQSIISPGEAVSLEVIYGDQPNTVFYGKDGYNYLAFLELVAGDDPTIDPDQSKVFALNELMKDKIASVETLYSDTTDGEMIARAPKVTDWKFIISDKVPNESLKNLDLDNDIKSLSKFLDKDNSTANSLGKELTNFEVLKDKSRDLSDEREAINQKLLDDFKLPIKKKILNLINKLKPSVRGNVEQGAYDGIEGAIFSDKSTGEKFKVVDRETFTKINKFNYQVRQTIAGKISSLDPELPIESRGGIVGEARIRSIKLFGLENAELPTQTKRILEKFKGSTVEETIGNITDSLHQLNFEAIKRKIQAIYATSLVDLEEALDAFKIHSDEYKLDLDNGQTIKYTKEIKRRTLMVFAEAKKNMQRTMYQIKHSKDMYALIEYFFSNQLSSISGEDKK